MCEICVENGGSPNPTRVIVIIFGLFIVLLLAAKKSGNNNGAGTRQSGGSQSWEAERRREKEERERKEREQYSRYKADHPEFSEADLFDYVKKLFTKMQEGWEAGDITNVQYGFAPDTWQRFDTQLSMKKQRGETTHVRDILFHSITVTGFRSLPVENREKISLRILVEYNVWVTDKNGKNIQGSPSTRHLMTYVWSMQRTYGGTAEKPADMNHCPNCGAELDISAFAECPFCHTGITQASSNWVIRDIQAESQKTVSR